ncbi:hypothetical protein JA9_001437 [Meyerozyma sp. JA9]|nr:hypothetical protein JA9_001437 [Meyerozyma sp. JA9]
MELPNYTEAVLPNLSNISENGELYPYQLLGSNHNQTQNQSVDFMPYPLSGPDDPSLDTFSPTHSSSFLSSPQHSYSSRHDKLSPQLQRHSGPVDMSSDQPAVDQHHYPDMTTMINANSSMTLPMVETTFVDYSLCSVCGKRINRDMSRHMKTHRQDSRFACMFPKSQCNHKSGRFNRRYDFKKHLLNRHFEFDDPEIKNIITLAASSRIEEHVNAGSGFWERYGSRNMY